MNINNPKSDLNLILHNVNTWTPAKGNELSNYFIENSLIIY